MKRLERDEARQYGKRGARVRIDTHRHAVEGEYLTTREVAARLGVSRSTADSRIRAARGLEGAVTWAKLGRAAGNPGD